MRRIAVVNAKGGTGKTTCVVNVATALGELGERVLVVDLDPQGTACDGLGVLHSGADGYDLRDVIDGTAGSERLGGLVQKTAVANVWAIPASARLEGLSLREMEGAGRARVQYLRTALDELQAHGPGWSYVLMDTAPTVGPAQIAALVAASEAFIPLNPSPAALPGLQTAREAIQRVRGSANRQLALGGVILCRVRRTRLHMDIAEQLQRSLPGLVFRTKIRESVRVEEAHGWCRPVVDYDPHSDVTEDFRALAAEMVDRAGGDAQRPTRGSTQAEGAPAASAAAKPSRPARFPLATPRRTT